MKAGGELRSVKTEEGQFGNRVHTRVQCRQLTIPPSVEMKSFGAVSVAPQAASDTGRLVRCDRRCPPTRLPRSKRFRGHMIRCRADRQTAVY